MFIEWFKPSNIYYKILALRDAPHLWKSILACPFGEPLHYHHDACPSCYPIILKKHLEHRK